jgi:hypothetical protein
LTDAQLLQAARTEAPAAAFVKPYTFEPKTTVKLTGACRFKGMLENKAFQDEI